MKMYKFLFYFSMLGLLLSCDQQNGNFAPLQTHSSINFSGTQVNGLTPSPDLYTIPLSSMPPSAILPPQSIKETITPKIANHELSFPHNLISRAIDDLSRKLNMPKERVTVLEVNQIELTIQDFNCLPMQENIELPAILFGSEIILSAQGKHYRYVGHGLQIWYCPRTNNGE